MPTSLPPLDMIIGIAVKLWFINLIKALQGVHEKTISSDGCLLTTVHDMMMQHIAVLEEEIHHGKERGI
jgi:hypothetical protein